MNDPAEVGQVAVCFAMTDESRLFTAGPGEPGVTVIHTGVGGAPDLRERFARRLAAAGSPRLVISAGYVGALSPILAVGDLVLAENRSSPALLSRARDALAGEPVHVGALLTTPDAVEHARDKARLHRETGAIAVDMETAWIAEACASAGLPLLSLRVVSDAAGEDFPVPNRVLYDVARQTPRYVALPLWLALHPSRIGTFVRFVRALGPARERLTRALHLVLAKGR